MKTNWTRPGLGDSLHHLLGSLPDVDVSDLTIEELLKPTSLELLKDGPLEKYDVERVTEVLRRVRRDGRDCGF